MNDSQAAFVEEMGQYLGSLGMTPDVGPDAGLAADLRPGRADGGATSPTSLQASRGAISGAARALETAGFIRRSRRRGDRREYFSVPPGRDPQPARRAPARSTTA